MPKTLSELLKELGLNFLTKIFHILVKTLNICLLLLLPAVRWPLCAMESGEYFQGIMD
jgi:hypothetical protein